MEDLIVDINWLAVIVGAVLAFMLGWLWYSPKLFGNKWAAAVGINMSAPSKPMSIAMLAQAVSTFLLAWVIGITERADSLSTAVLVGLMVAGLIKANGLFAQKPRYAVMVESSFILAMVAVMIATHVVL